jgi:hypothetical protein
LFGAVTVCEPMRMSLQMRFRVPQGANAPRSWLHDVCSLHKATLAVHIRTPTKSCGRQPAVLPKNVSATASDFRTATTFARCKQPHNHGGLTPPAPGCTRFVRRIKRHWQFTYARRLRAAGVSPPWLEKRACRTIRFMFGERTYLDKNGGCQPAVVEETRLQGASLRVRRTNAP